MVFKLYHIFLFRNVLINKNYWKKEGITYQEKESNLAHNNFEGCHTNHGNKIGLSCKRGRRQKYSEIRGMIATVIWRGGAYYTIPFLFLKKKSNGKKKAL